MRTRPLTRVRSGRLPRRCSRGWPARHRSSSRSTTSSGSTVLRPRVLEFVARRLEDRPVGFFLSLRTPTDVSAPLGLDRSLGPERLERVTVGPMSAGALYQLIKARLGLSRSAAPTLVRIHRATGGNPFFALELATSLVRDRRAGGGGAAARPGRRARVDRGQAAEAAGARPGKTLVFAAAMPDPTVDALRRAVRASSPSRCSSGLRRRRRPGSSSVEGESRPLHASVVRVGDLRGGLGRGATPSAPQAGSAGGEHGAARAASRALHGEPDSEVARTVAAAAGEVRRRGAPEAAVELAELAIRLTPGDDRDERDRRAARARLLPHQAGDPERARGVLLAVATAGPAARAGASRSCRSRLLGRGQLGRRSHAASRRSWRRRVIRASRRRATRSWPSIATSMRCAASGTRAWRSSCSARKVRPPTWTRSPTRSWSPRAPVSFSVGACRSIWSSARSSSSRGLRRAWIGRGSARSSVSG